ncbi:MAG: hypothetical protein KJ584_05230, partial [Candidatus Omnitrophica bacterium]|nr:hypothetical protein [Candidatus Omnitrophota bacterium]
RYGFNPDKHKVVGVFVKRGQVPQAPVFNPKTDADKIEVMEQGLIEFVTIDNPLAIDVSSTKIRDAAKGTDPKNWILTPYEAYKYIMKHQGFLDNLKASSAVEEGARVRRCRLKHFIASIVGTNMFNSIDHIDQEIGGAEVRKRMIIEAGYRCMADIDSNLKTELSKAFLSQDVRLCVNREKEYKQPEDIFEQHIKSDDLKIGVVCTAANPLSIVHILKGLKTMGEYGLDKVLYAPMGADNRWPELGATMEWRYEMVRAMMRVFEPLMTFSDIGDLKNKMIDHVTMKNGEQRYARDREDYAFRIFSLNPNKKITLYYIAGTVRYLRFNERGKNDTINKLLENVIARRYGFNPDKHKVVGVFVKRGQVPQAPVFNPKTDADKIEVMDEGLIKFVTIDNPLAIELTREKVKEAAKGNDVENWILTTYEAYKYIMEHPGYLDVLKRAGSPVLEEGRRVGDILKRWFMAAIESSNPWEYLKNKGIREEIEKWRTAMEEEGKTGLPSVEEIYRRIEDILYRWIHIQKLGNAGAGVEKRSEGIAEEEDKSCNHPITSRAIDKLMKGTTVLAQELEMGADDTRKEMIEEAYGELLHKVDVKLSEGEIVPYLVGGVRTCKDRSKEYVAQVKDVRLREDDIKLAIICTAARPPHVVHLMMGLKVMGEYGVDRILFAPSGTDDDKLELEETIKWRYDMVINEVLPIFEPLMTFTDLGDLRREKIETMVMKNGESRRLVNGEDYAFRIFEMNPDTRITLYYIVGTDHYNQIKKGKNDTINKLLENVIARRYGFNPDKHKVVGVFVKRGQVPQAPVFNPKTDADKIEVMDEGVVRFDIMDNPFEAGVIPAAIRRAINDKKHKNWMLTTYEAYKYIMEHPGYLDVLKRAASPVAMRYLSELTLPQIKDLVQKSFNRNHIWRTA